MWTNKEEGKKSLIIPHIRTLWPHFDLLLVIDSEVACSAALIVWREHSHVAVRLLLETFVGRHAQRHLTHLAAETALVPVLERGREQKHEESTGVLRAFRVDRDGTNCIKHDE